jgi:hypothetical protein
MEDGLYAGEWCDRMMCHVTGREQTGPNEMTYRLAWMNAPNMSGAIWRATEDLPGVESIRCHAAGKPNVHYEKIGKKWVSVYCP